MCGESEGGWSSPGGDDDPWDVSYGYIGQEPKIIRCANEEEADTLSRVIHMSFGATSNWKISAYRVECP